MSMAKATSAGAWSAVDIVLRQVVGFVVSVILARLLSPADFGLIALLGFFTSLSIVFVQGGLTLALVQKQDTTPEQETAVFWTNLCSGIFFALILIAFAPSIARFYGYPLLSSLMYVAAAQVVLSSLGAVQAALLTRSMRFAQLTKAGIAASILSGVAGVAAALSGWGVWALAVQIVVQATVGGVGLWFVSDWRPGGRYRFSSIRGLIGFGANISLSSTLDVVYVQGFALLLGKLHGVSDLGLFNRAISTQSLPAGILSAVISRVSLPMFAERAGDAEALKRAFGRALRFTALVNTPLVIGIALVAEPLLLVLFGEQWIAAAPILIFLSFNGLFLPFHTMNVQLIIGTGDSATFLRLEIYKKIISILIVAVGSYFGVIGLAVAINVAGIYGFFVNVAPVSRRYGLNWIAQIASIRGVLAATAFMSAAVLTTKYVLRVGPEVELAALSIVGVLSYLLFYLFVPVLAFEEARDLVKDFWSRRRLKTAG